MPNGRRVNTVYRSISRPLTILGAERKLFFFAMCIGAATFNLLGSLLGGILHRPMGHRDGPANPAFPADLHQAPHALRPSEVQSGNDPQGEPCLTFADSSRITKKPAHSTSRSAHRALLMSVSFSQSQAISVPYLKCVAWTSNASTEIQLTVLPNALNRH